MTDMRELMNAPSAQRAHARRRSAGFATTLATAAAFALAAAPAMAQSVAGTVVDQGSGQAIPGAVITLRTIHGDSVGTVLSDQRGAFRFQAETGWYAVIARTLGYAEATTRAFEVKSGDPTLVDIKLSVDALPLDRIDVEVRQGPWYMVERPQREWPFWERHDWYSKIGIGRFIMRDQMRQFSDVEHAIKFYMDPRTRVQTAPQLEGNCDTVYYLDGLRYGDVIPILYPEEILGIEMYFGPAQIPLEMTGFGVCNVISVWRDPRRGGR